MLGVLDSIFFVLAAIGTALVGAFLSVWVWLPSQASPSHTRDSRVVAGRVLIAAATGVGWAEMWIGELPGRLRSSYYFGMPIGRLLLLVGFVSAVAFVAIAWAVLPPNHGNAVSKRVRSASIILLAINGFAGVLYVIAQYWQ